MIDPELVAKIRLLFFAEHWKIGTIATQLNLHRDTVRAALETDRFNRPKQERTSCKTDPYVDFIRQTLAQYPRLRSTRIFQMIRARGYEGGSSQLRRLVARLRPVVQEPFLQLRTFPGEQGQADWADFGEVRIGHVRRQLGRSAPNRPALAHLEIPANEETARESGVATGQPRAATERRCQCNRDPGSFGKCESHVTEDVGPGFAE